MQYTKIGKGDNRMRILFTICGRAGSKGIKNKNIQNFLGKPLALYTLSAIHLFLKVHEDIEADIALNTDSPELVNIVKRSDMCPVDWIPRKESLSGDTVSKVSVIRDTYLEMKTEKGYDYDMIVDMDITSPLRTLRDIQNLIEKMEEAKSDVVFTVTDARRNPYFNMVKKSDKGYVRVIKSDYTARQQTPALYDMNASMYAYNPQFLISGKEIFQGYCEVVKMYDTGILDLDHENDLELMEVIAEYLYSKKEEYAQVKKGISYIF